MIHSTGQRPLGELLAEEGLIPQEELDAALGESKKSGDRLGDVLLKMRLIDEERLAQVLGRQPNVRGQIWT